MRAGSVSASDAIKVCTILAMVTAGTSARASNCLRHEGHVAAALGKKKITKF
jgi:hypothetical protein